MGVLENSNDMLKHILIFGEQIEVKMALQNSADEMKGRTS